jgi:mono/diheme cytochrome c family protein
MRRSTTIAILVVLSTIVAVSAVLYKGVFNVGADVPHSRVLYELLEFTRARSIAVRAQQIEVPPLVDSTLVAQGARDYAEMCVECHLAPDTKESELRQGLYPKPPDLTKPIDASAAEMYWVIKHGIKMSAMPAWGRTHSDARIWAMVAFIKQLPTLNPEQYLELIAVPPSGDEPTEHAPAASKSHPHHGHAEHR